MTQPAALVLTTVPGSPGLAPARLEAAWALIPEGARADCGWLGEPDAWQARFWPSADLTVPQVRGRVAAPLEPHAIDVNVVAEGLDRRKKLLVADMESTIIQQEMLDELAGYIGQREKVAAITERAMRGELDFAAALRERVALLAGLDARVLDEVAERMTPMPGADALVGTMRANGAYCALVSGGFTVFTRRIADRLGFDEHQANTLEIDRGRLTGRVVEPILGREAKLAVLQRLSERLGLSADETLAVGDGANDLAMLGAAGLGVAFRAKPLVRAQAEALLNGAVVTHGDLTALLYLQGYSRAEFTSR
jgi:phosphoserine phosphatase